MRKLFVWLACVAFGTALGLAQPKPKTTLKPSVAPPTEIPANIKPILERSTCLTCHKLDKNDIGPSFLAIAGRKYSTAQIVQRVYKPDPKSWPNFTTPMPAMAHIPRADVQKIATWIKSIQPK